MSGTDHGRRAPASADGRAGDRVTVRPLDPCGQLPGLPRGHSHICQNLKFIGIDAPGAMQGLWTVPAHTLHRPAGSSVARAGRADRADRGRLPRCAAGRSEVGRIRGGAGRRADRRPDRAGGEERRGARVIVSEVNPFRLKLASSLGLETVNPRETDLIGLVNAETGGAGADVVFEVSGSAAGGRDDDQAAASAGQGCGGRDLLASRRRWTCSGSSGAS